MNQLYRQLVARFEALPPLARVAVVLLPLLLVAVTYALSWQPWLSHDVELFRGRAFTADELLQVEAAFARNSLSQYSLEDGRIYVPRGRQSQYVEALVKSDALPLDAADELEAKLSEWSIFSDPQARREVIRIAKQNRLAQIIQQSPDIQKAWVEIDEVQRGGLHRTKLVAASVSVKPARGRSFGPDRIRQLRDFVAQSIAGLDAKRVAVFDLDGGVSYSASSEDNPYLDRLKQYEAYYRGQVLDCLSHVPGVTATVHVELDKTVRQYREVVSPQASAMRGGKTSALSLSWQDWLGESEKQAVTKGNQPDRLSAEKKDQPSGRGGETLHIEQAGLTPLKVQVAVGVPRDYFKTVWQERNPNSPVVPDEDKLAAIESAETDKIRRAVAAVIPHHQADPTAAVTVTTFVSIPPPELPVPQPEAPHPFTWLEDPNKQIGLGIAAALLVVFLVLVLWPRGQSEKTQTAGSGRRLRQDNDHPAHPTEPHSRESAAEAAGLKQQLMEMAQRDPSSAAEVLRQWVGNTEESSP